MAVYYHRIKDRWIVRVMRGAKYVQLGSYTSEIEAQAVDMRVRQEEKDRYSRGWFERTSRQQLHDLPARYKDGKEGVRVPTRRID